MTYDLIVTYSGLASLMLFLAMFLCVLAYAFWPGNREKFERAKRIPFEQDADDRGRRGGENGR